MMGTNYLYRISMFLNKIMTVLIPKFGTNIKSKHFFLFLQTVQLI